MSCEHGLTTKECYVCMSPKYGEKKNNMSITAMRQALEALERLFGIPEQFTGKGGGDVAVWRLGGSYRAQQAIPVLRQAIDQAEKQEPVAFASHGVVNWIADKQFQHEADLYTTPQPQRPWVGLTDEEVADLGRHELWIKQFIRTVEAKLKEKNT